MAGRDRGRAALAALFLAAGSGRAMPPVDAVSVVGAARHGEYLESLCREVKGAGYDEEAVARVEAALRATGIPEDVAVRYEDGRLIATIREAPLLESVEVSCGAPCPIEEDDWRTGLVRGRRVHAADLDGAVAGIARQVAARGYPAARVDLTVERVEAEGQTPRAVVSVGIALGTGTRIRAIEVKPAGEDAARLLAALAGEGIEVAAVLDRARVARALQSEREELLDQGEVGARLDASARRGEEGVTLVVEVVHGPHLELFVDGDAPSRRKRRRLLEDAPPRAELAAEVVAQLVEEELEEEGYWGSRATASVAGERIDVTVERARRVRVSAVSSTLPPGQEGLLALLETRPSGYSITQGYRRERPTRRRLAGDRRRLEQALLAEGYVKPAVGEPEVRIQGGKATVHFPVRAGKRTVATDVTLAGWPDELPPPLLLTRAGGGFSEARLEEDRRALEAQLQAAGFLEARVDYRAKVGSPLERDVDIDVTAGERARISGVAVAGAGWLAPGVLAELAGLDEGETMTRARLDEAESDAGAAPLLSGVTLLPLEPWPGGGPRPVVMEAREGPRYRFRYALGYNSEEGPRGTLGFTDLAFLRGPRSLSLLVRGGELDRRVELSLVAPQGFIAQRPLTVTAFAGREGREGFDLEKSGALVAFGLLGRRSSGDALTLSFLKKEIELFDVTISESEIPRDERSVSLLEATLEGIMDRTDDPLSPSRGFRVKAGLERALPELDATADFVKAAMELSGYVPVARGIVAAASVRGGWGRPMGEDVEIPISERFFLGGTSGMRAFGRDRVGPRDEASGEPLGGEAFHHEVLELRVPISGGLGGSLFYERGDVVADAADLELSRGTADWGVGLRYRTPAGPVRIEYAREVGGEQDRIVLSLGEAF